jgi:hypothetical protein
MLINGQTLVCIFKWIFLLRIIFCILGVLLTIYPDNCVHAGRVGHA